ncbi:MAG: ABC transporter ATP-binding protein [Candidatus Heimdallarchaeota archaeon]|nr:ABC transporter ATP-binding protein [Candidatus Heimdallarchaeota archaeon]MCK5048352.1 ABC transporter ATP-binding protein [Candidatus Heimdallarchaeota archaeon]
MKLITINNLTVKYGKASFNTLSDFSLEIKKNEFIALIGENGSGKSTFLQTLNGLIPHMIRCYYSGKITVDDREVTKLDIAELSQTVGSVFQVPENQFITSSVYRELAFALENQQLDPLTIQEKVEEALKNDKIEGLKDRSPYTLSAGEQQLVILSAILLLKPKILCLDEPASMLDIKRKDLLLEKLVEYSKSGGTVILTTQEPSFYWDHLTRIIHLSNGAIKADLPISECKYGSLPTHFIPFEKALTDIIPENLHSIIEQLNAER